MLSEPYINYFGEADYRGKRTKFGIKAEDRARHVYVIGKTGMGKSTVLENMAVQDIQRGEGVAFIDPHGGTAEKLLDYIPAERVKDLIYLAPHDLEFPVAFNIMENLGKDKNYLVANGLIATFKKIWPDVWSARMEYILNNVLLALLEYPDSTILGVNRMLSDLTYRRAVVDNVSDPSVRSFWVDEFANYTERMAAESVPAIQNKIGQFTSNPLIRNIVGQPKSTFDLREVMDKKKILIMNLSKGRVGEINANLLGGMLITKIYLSAMSRADKNAAELAALPPFYFYVDEFQSFVNDTFADILSEARKYKLSLTMAHQYIEQMPEEVRDAVFGNVGTTIAFRVGPFDAEILEKLFTPKFLIEDIVSLGRFQMYLTLMINQVGSPPFSARGMPPIPPPAESFHDLVIESSREMYARPRVDVEAEISKWHEPIQGTRAPEETLRPGGGRGSGPGGGTKSGYGARAGGGAPGRGGSSSSNREVRGQGGFGPRSSSVGPERRFGDSRGEREGRSSAPGTSVGTQGAHLAHGSQGRSLPEEKSPPRETISLSSLAKDAPGAAQAGGGQHLSDLRNTLKQVLSNQPHSIPNQNSASVKKAQSPPAAFVETNRDNHKGRPTPRSPIEGKNQIPTSGRTSSGPGFRNSKDELRPAGDGEGGSKKQKEIPRADLEKMLKVDMPPFS
ncbi:MAG: hypothetical protein COV10_01935 [Candidatus Vogelbacteria bacterium CG10_big_fil_rev_8_21_14_0_10_51_16]|uniref:Uncharacterized protein n=1 Tax=Candidatus Vogelbacteria bacterium CG10_big_fil_rev_8_21_14_0_10_51_16 TaxID=1975045 RepID=A0A2H0REK7_9BACT|nr:MAG: hypothetical protein COV10_01935 [Candidatus Vogelbacteria bacterium CG10_big_fil_rev_8_21_14_0_10_51_16]